MVSWTAAQLQERPAPRHAHPDACAAMHMTVRALGRINSDTMEGLLDAERDLAAAAEMLERARRRVARAIDARNAAQLKLVEDP